MDEFLVGVCQYIPKMYVLFKGESLDMGKHDKWQGCSTLSLCRSDNFCYDMEAEVSKGDFSSNYFDFLKKMEEPKADIFKLTKNSHYFNKNCMIVPFLFEGGASNYGEQSECQSMKFKV